MKALRVGTNAGTRGDRFGAAPHAHPPHSHRLYRPPKPVFHTSATWGHFHPTHLRWRTAPAPFRVGAAARGQPHTHSFERARATSCSARALGFFEQHISCTARSSSTIDAPRARAVCGEAQTLADSRMVSCWWQQTAERARAAAAAAHDDADRTRTQRACWHESAVVPLLATSSQALRTMTKSDCSHRSCAGHV